MSPSRQEYPSSLYPEVGSSYRSGYSNSTGGYPSRRNSTNSHSYGDYPRGRDHGHRDRDERHLRDAHSTNSRRGHSHDRDTDDRKNRSSSNNNNTIKQRTRGIWEKFIPPDYRPSQADPEARHHRLSKEHESEAFDWTPGVVLALMGAAALFSVERSLVKRQKKDYIQR